MSNETMQMVPVRLLPERVAEIDAITEILGGNRSEFVRMAVDERLQRMAPLLVSLADARLRQAQAADAAVAEPAV